MISVSSSHYFPKKDTFDFLYCAIPTTMLHPYLLSYLMEDEPVIEEIPERHVCSIHGPLINLSRRVADDDDIVFFEGLLDIDSDLDYLLDVPREQQLSLDVYYNHRLSQGPRQRFLHGASVEANGLFYVQYDEDGKAYLSVDAYDLRPQPGNPFSKEYVRRGLPKSNPGVFFTGIVTGIAVDRPDCRVYTFHLRVTRDEGDPDFGFQPWEIDFDIHCAIRMTVRWANRRLPQIGDFCLVSGELAGLYWLDGRHSPLVRAISIQVSQLVPPEDDDPEENDDVDDDSEDSE